MDGALQVAAAEDVGVRGGPPGGTRGGAGEEFVAVGEEDVGVEGVGRCVEEDAHGGCDEGVEGVGDVMEFLGIC